MKIVLSIIFCGLLFFGNVASAQTREIANVSPQDGIIATPHMLLRTDNRGRMCELWRFPQADSLETRPFFFECLLSGRVRLDSNSDWEALENRTWDHSQSRTGHILSKAEGVCLTGQSDHTQGVGALGLTYVFDPAAEIQFRMEAVRPGAIKDSHFDREKRALVLNVGWRNFRTDFQDRQEEKFLIRTIPYTEPHLKDGIWQWDFSKTAQVRFVFEVPVKRVGEPIEDALIRLETDDGRLDRLFSESFEQIRTLQFASGAYMTDVFWYRDCWIRDGAYAINGVALAGGLQSARAFFDFWQRKGGFSVGGEREAQQPGILMASLRFVGELVDDKRAFWRSYWEYIHKNADYYVKRIAQAGGMIDTSEEWICFVPAKSTWPNAEIYAGLVAAAQIARELGETQCAERWEQSARRLRADFLERAYDSSLKRFIPLAGEAGKEFVDPVHPEIKSYNGPLRDTRLDSGLLTIARLSLFAKGLGIVAVDDPRFESTLRQIDEGLSDGKGGLFRFGPNPESPHSPKGEAAVWPIVMAWRAQTALLQGDREAAWRFLNDGILRSKIFDLPKNQWRLPEAWNREGKPNKIFLLPWGHGEFVASVLFLLTGMELSPEGADIGFSPWLPASMGHAKLSGIRFRGWDLTLEIKRDSSGTLSSRLSGTRQSPQAPEALKVKLKDHILTLQSAGELSW